MLRRSLGPAIDQLAADVRRAEQAGDWATAVALAAAASALAVRMHGLPRRVA